MSGHGCTSSAFASIPATEDEVTVDCRIILEQKCDAITWSNRQFADLWLFDVAQHPICGFDIIPRDSCSGFAGQHSQWAVSI